MTGSKRMTQSDYKMKWQKVIRQWKHRMAKWRDKGMPMWQENKMKWQSDDPKEWQGDKTMEWHYD